MRPVRKSRSHKTAKDYIQEAARWHLKGDFRKAEKGYLLALELEPDNPSALGCLGQLYHEMWRTDEAVQYMEKALDREPNNASGWYCLGLVYWFQGRLDDALMAMNKAIALEPQTATWYLGRSKVLRELCRDHDAIAACDRGLQLDPEFHELRGERGLNKMRLGDWAGGFADYEARFTAFAQDCPSLPAPRWDGKSKPDVLVLLAEQGYGDVIQFARFGPYLQSQGQNIRLLVGPDIADLIRTTGCPVITPYDSLPKSYQWAPFMSLPGLLGATPDNIPGTVPYLKAERAHIWAPKFDKSFFNVGVVYHPRRRLVGGYRARILPIANGLDKLFLPGTRFYSLQWEGYDPVEPALYQLPGRDTNPNKKFLDTAACMVNMDLVISTDTSTAHLAGALGVPTWVPLPKGGDWRWGLEGDTSPWYPTMKLFRQTEHYRWDDVFDRMAKELADVLRQRK